MKKKQQEAFLNQIAKKQFDLRRPPLFYFGLLKVSARRSLLILSFYYIDILRQKNLLSVTLFR